jgi:hypothetical protein
MTLNRAGRIRPPAAQTCTSQICLADPNAEPVLSAEVLDLWNENGYVVLHNAVTPEQCRRCPTPVRRTARPFQESFSTSRCGRASGATIPAGGSRP